MTCIDQPTRPRAGIGSERYRILGRLGVGGMAIVYEASDSRLHRPVALKVVRREQTNKRDAFRQLEQEAMAMARVNSSHVCSLYDLAEWNGRPCLTMERLEGQTLQARIAMQPMDTVEVLGISRQIAEALEAVHRVGLIHHDIKPSNVFVTTAGAVKLIDFGLAEPYEAASSHRDPRGRARTSVLGTTNYISPERILRRPVDRRSDLFSLGAIIYELTTGQPPFAASSPVEVLFNVLNSAPPPIRARTSGWAVAVDRLVRTLLAKSPERRYESATDVKKELAKIEISASSPAAASNLKRRSPTRGKSSWLPQPRSLAMATA